MTDYLISLPPGYTIKAVLDSAANVQVWVVANGEVLAGSIVGLEWLQIVEWFPPDTPPVPPPPSVVLYECRVDKLYIREIPDRTSPDMGSLKRGQRVGVVAVVTEGSETWGKLETGGYAAIKIGTNVYLEKVETGG